jgi:hypothetical protein
MSKPFIKVRFDRMQNEAFKTLCENIMHTIEKYDLNTLGLEDTFNNFKGQVEPLLNHLDIKQRKMPQSDTIIDLRKRLNELVTALLLYVKSLKQAAFIEQAESIAQCYAFIRSNFKGFVHQNIFAQNTLLNNLTNKLRNEGMTKACDELRIMRFVDEINQTRKKIDDLQKQRTVTKLSQPEAGSTLIAKEQLISELKYLFMSIERQILTQPETDYKPLVAIINTYLIDARAQLRNLASRRKTAKTKAQKKKENNSSDE